jgi:Tfp pilus assembly protein PilO
MKLNENQKIIVAVLGVIVLAGALGALNYLKFKERGELQAKLESLRKEEQKANELIAQIPELRKKREDLANIIDQYTSILPLEEHIQHEAFAEIVDNYRKETNVVIQKLEPVIGKDSEGADGDDGNFLRHRYHINLIGSFPDFLRFINKIENHTRFLKIDEIKIKPLGAQEQTQGLSDKNEAELLELAKMPFKEIEVVVSTYTYKRDTEAQAVSK